jgi:hypothetical protein
MRQPFLVGYYLVGRRDMDDGRFGHECVIKDNGCVSRDNRHAKDSRARVRADYWNIST